MLPHDIYQFIHDRKLAVIATIGPDGGPQSALIGFAISPELMIIFDTARSSRKYANLRRDPRAAIVFGWENETTVQYEGLAVELSGEALNQAKNIYFAAWPDGRKRETSPEITYFMVKPVWIRYSDFDRPQIEELRF